MRFLQFFWLFMLSLSLEAASDDEPPSKNCAGNTPPLAPITQQYHITPQLYKCSRGNQSFVCFGSCHIMDNQSMPPVLSKFLSNFDKLLIEREIPPFTIQDEIKKFFESDGMWIAALSKEHQEYVQTVLSHDSVVKALQAAGIQEKQVSVEGLVILRNRLMTFGMDIQLYNKYIVADKIVGALLQGTKYQEHTVKKWPSTWEEYCKFDQPKTIKSVCQAYASGDIFTLQKQGKFRPNEYFEKENAAMADALNGMKFTEKTLFVCGALHLVGKNSVLNKLENHRWTVKKLDTTDYLP